jgi:2-polyprenyl-6-methoxyphenol hydroxylase-like FAD-dependent oxidoreductase
VLRNRVIKLSPVTRLFGWSAAAAAADYLVGCDGARSQVREQAGIASEGADFDQRMILAVFRSRELHEHLDRFPLRTTYRVLHPELNGYRWFFGRVDQAETWFFHAPVHKDATAANVDAHALIERAALHPRPAGPVRRLDRERPAR